MGTLTKYVKYLDEEAQSKSSEFELEKKHAAVTADENLGSHLMRIGLATLREVFRSRGMVHAIVAAWPVLPQQPQLGA